MVWQVKKSASQKVGQFTIVQDDILLPNQDNITFSYVQFAKGVCILALTQEEQVLCLKQYRHAVKSFQWELPAGMIDQEDENPLEAAKRELEEETGYIAKHWTSLGSFHPSPGSTSEEIFLFLATDLEKTVQSLESSEQIEVYKLSMDEVQNLIANGHFQHGGGLAAILKYLSLEKKMKWSGH